MARCPSGGRGRSHWTWTPTTGRGNSPPRSCGRCSSSGRPICVAAARGADRRTPRWDALTRLVAPLDEARAVLHHAPTARYRRAGAHAAGLVLQHCAETGRAYWGWTAPDWATLCCPSAEEFLAARTLPTEITVRPFLV